MCGIFGVFDNPDASKIVKEGLFALQHRGQESAGIITYEKGKLIIEKRMGLVNEIFTKDILKRLQGKIAIGHTRYSTQGGSLLKNAQPHFSSDSSLALVSNGDIPNTKELKQELIKSGEHFYSDNDGEILVKTIDHYLKKDNTNISRRKKIINAIKRMMKKVRGAYSVLMLTNKGELFVFRDPLGFRPLSIGKINSNTLVFASETCAFDLVRANYQKEIKPGEILTFPTGEKTVFSSNKNSFCIFELIYFSRPDSFTFSKNVSQVKQSLGKRLAKDFPVKADVVIPIPDSSNHIALGYSKMSGIPFDFGLTRSHYVGRTFIAPSQKIRDFEVRLKFNPNKAELEGKKVVAVDDSIVRGTTMKKLVKMIRGAGAKEVHVRIGSPPITNSCFFGVDTPTKEELIAFSKNTQEIRDYITADSLEYQSLEGLRSVINNPEDFCYACFTGDYPV